MQRGNAVPKVFNLTQGGPGVTAHHTWHQDDFLKEVWMVNTRCFRVPIANNTEHELEAALENGLIIT